MFPSQIPITQRITGFYNQEHLGGRGFRRPETRETNAVLLRVQLAILILLSSFPAAAQMDQRGRVILQLVIMLEGEKMPTQEQVTVTLMDGWGNVVIAQDTRTGFVQLDVRSGLYRLNISGPGIETYFGEFTIGSTPTWSETIQLRPKRTTLADKRPTEPIPAVRLKIPRKAQDEYRRAETALKKNDAEAARLHLNQAIALYPNYDLAYFALGKLEIAAGRREAARTNFERAVKLNEAFGEAQRELAKILLAEKDYAAAEPALLAALRSDPGDLWTLSFTALTELELGRFAEALACVSHVHSVKHEGYASVHLIAAKSLEALHRQEQARAEYQQYLSEDPNGSNASRAREGLARLAGIPK
jgi:tetratricopeptide (TPR) repeat protein